MEYLIISVAAFLVAILTFFSGFGLGTILTPLFMIFFPVDLAIALTGVVHFSNNIFKIALIGKNIDRGVLLRFGLPAIFTAFAGAWVLLSITELPVITHYNIGNREFFVTPVKLIIAFLLVVFSIMEFLPGIRKIQFNKDKLFVGGLISGFFGGLTGMQGAIRSAFLIKSGLSKQAYIATGVAIACLIDISRLSVYSSRFLDSGLSGNLPLVVSATLSAMAGALIGNSLLKKITLRFIQSMVAVLLIIVAIALGMGLI
jgi:uncharacterized protein